MLIFYTIFFLFLHFHNTHPAFTKFPLSLFGYPLACPLGIAACPLMTSAGIAATAQRGYAVFTYKTIRTSFCPIFSPVLYHVNIDHQLTPDDIGKKYTVNGPVSIHDNSSIIAVTNSFGINSQNHAETIQDIAQARAALSEEQILIVSIYGSGKNEQEQIADFVHAAHIAYQGGAQVIEANFSCPNLGQKKMAYQNPDLVYTICHAIHTAIPLPLIIKVGVFENRADLAAIIRAAYNGGARGMCGINTISIQAVDDTGNPIFGSQRQFSGLSGDPLRTLALQFVHDARSIIDETHLDFVLFATGGVTKPEHFDLFFAAGADIVLSATGAMRNSSLADNWHAAH
ncbi:MAG TPA: tRNA-dihydrouridine synthase [Candidatus Bathyarchaeia archaeon]|nr:tRNA-dihydrouridine synthase [Candidatus Bathyarchaeia archaeon]